MIKETYISYAWVDSDSKSNQEQNFIDDLVRTLRNKGVSILIDKEELTYKKSIRTFMQALGQGNRVIMIISDKYLKSRNCMYEALQILRDENFYNRIYPIVLKDAKIYDPIMVLDYVEYWNAKIDQLNQKLINMNSLAYAKPMIDELELYIDIRRLVAKFASLISDMITLTPEKLQIENYRPLLNELIKEQSFAPKYGVDIVFCIDTGISETSLSYLKRNFILEFIERVKLDFEKSSKTISVLRVKLIEINNEVGIDTKFYNINNQTDLGKFFKVLNTLDYNVVEDGLIKFERAIRSDWLDIYDRSRHVIIIFSERGLHVDDIPSFEHISDLWSNGEYLTYKSQRMIVFGPDKFPWEDISKYWHNAIHYPTMSLASDMVNNKEDIDTIVSLINRSV